MTTHEGERTSLEAELLTLLPWLLALARRLSRDANRAEDLAQDTLVRAWRARDRFTPGTNLRAWLATIMHRQLGQDLRRAWRTVALDSQIAENTLPAIDNPEAVIQLDEVRRALQRLPTLQCETLLQISVGGASYIEASLRRGCGVGTIKSQVSRARSRLLEALEVGDLPRDDTRPSNASACLHAIAQGAETATRPAKAAG